MLFVEGLHVGGACCQETTSSLPPDTAKLGAFFGNDALSRWKETENASYDHTAWETPQRADPKTQKGPCGRWVFVPAAKIPVSPPDQAVASGPNVLLCLAHLFPLWNLEGDVTTGRS